MKRKKTLYQPVSCTKNRFITTTTTIVIIIIIIIIIKQF